MKHLSLLSMLVSLSTAVQAQEVVIDTSYYTSPVRRRVLMADPDKNPGNHQIKSGRRADGRHDLINQLNEIQTWYVGAEGGFRTDGGTLSNSFNGLVSTPTPAKAMWEASLGYTYHNAWVIETGYTHAPIHLTMSIANNSVPLVYTYTNSGYGLPLRLKRRLGPARQAKNGTGFWLTAGAWLIPNGSNPTGDFKLIGYSYRGRSHVDTLRLTNTTTVANRVTGMAELGLDYATRLSSHLELGFYVRTYWGLGNALKADLVYTVNGSSQQQAMVTANGSGWGVGTSLRYIYRRQHELKKP